VHLKVDDYFQTGKRSLIRFREKGGKETEIPVHHKLEEVLDRYLEYRVFGWAANDVETFGAQQDHFGVGRHENQLWRRMEGRNQTGPREGQGCGLARKSLFS
jgi:hypothetical protein